jgi:hypothetical protein
MSAKPSDTGPRKGAKIPRFQAGKDGPSAFSASDMNRLVDALNAWLNPKIVRGDKDDIKISDSNVLITLAQGEGTGEPQRMYKLATPTAERPTVVEDDYLICRTWDGTTLGTTDVKIAKQFKHRLSLTSETVLNETHNYTYAADSNDTSTYKQNKIRTVTVGSETEEQRIVPPWCPGDIIFADIAENTGVTVGDTELTLIDTSESRQWARIR